MFSTRRPIPIARGPSAGHPGGGESNPADPHPTCVAGRGYWPLISSSTVGTGPHRGPQRSSCSGVYRRSTPGRRRVEGQEGEQSGHRDIVIDGVHGRTTKSSPSRRGSSVVELVGPDGLADRVRFVSNISRSRRYARSDVVTVPVFWGVGRVTCSLHTSSPPSRQSHPQEMVLPQTGTPRLPAWPPKSTAAQLNPDSRVGWSVPLLVADTLDVV